MPSNSKEQLLSKLAPVLAKNPSSSLTDIAAATGVGRATIYRQFKSRGALARELALQSMAEINQAYARIKSLGLSPLDEFMALMEEIVSMGDRYHFLQNEPGLEQDPEIAAIYEEQLAGLFDMIQGLKSAGVLDPHVSTYWAVSAVDALIWAAWMSVHEGYVAPKEAGALLVRTLLQGLGSQSLEGNQL